MVAIVKCQISVRYRTKTMPTCRVVAQHDALVVGIHIAVVPGEFDTFAGGIMLKCVASVESGRGTATHH